MGSFPRNWTRVTASEYRSRRSKIPPYARGSRTRRGARIHPDAVAAVSEFRFRRHDRQNNVQPRTAGREPSKFFCTPRESTLISAPSAHESSFRERQISEGDSYKAREIVMYCIVLSIGYLGGNERSTRVDLDGALPPDIAARLRPSDCLSS